MKFLLIIASLLIASPALAADNVALTSKVFVERQTNGPDGKPRLVREAPKLVVPGEKLLFILNYKNEGMAPADKFVVTNPIPASVAFVASDTLGAEYSVDGGKAWGSLASLTVKTADGSLRTATGSDVTHIRWVFAKPIPVGSSGTLSFQGAVR
jgi:uncharacterized repeat protein (TIGR01451 family)